MTEQDLVLQIDDQLIKCLVGKKTESPLDYARILNEKQHCLIGLFVIDRLTNKRITPRKSGINWGCTEGHTSNDPAIEAYIPITKKVVLTSTYFVPVLWGEINGMRVNIERRKTVIIWDDGTEMNATFAGTGPTINGLGYPKQLTSEGGGIILGRYLRNRMGISENQIVEYSDLREYGTDTVLLIKIHDGLYFADFSGRSFSDLLQVINH